MKIMNNPNIARIAQSYGTKINKTENFANDGKGSDKIEISEAAKDFQTAIKAFKDLPGIREDKVNALKERIENGSYKVTGRDVAEKMIGEIRRLSAD
jgi:negative regulator of flagellin synthesis FlgM